MSSKFPFLIPRYHSIAPRVDSVTSNRGEQQRRQSVLTPSRLSIDVNNQAIDNKKNFKQSFLTKERTIYALSVGICLLAIAFVVTLSILFANKQPEADYGQVCAEKPCKQSKRLSCLNYTCQCDPSEEYWFNGKCELKSLSERFHGQKCQKNITYCLGQSECLNDVCECNTTFSYWNGTNCVAKKTNNQPCFLDMKPSCLTNEECHQCLTNKGLACDLDLNKCVCSEVPNSYFDIVSATCLPVKSYYRPCNFSNECNSTQLLFCQTSTSTLATANCPSISIRNVCDCTNGFYYESTTSRCELKKSFTKFCITNCECKEVEQGMECLNSMCVCGQHKYFDTLTQKCEPLKDYMKTCTSDTQCKNNLGLACENGVCNCKVSQRLYWNSAYSICVLCPFGWDLIEITSGADKGCYYVSSFTLTWNIAFSRCKSFGADLVVFNDKAEFNAVRELLLYQGLAQWYFIGMTGTCGSTFSYINGVTGFYPGTSVNPFFWFHATCTPSVGHNYMLIYSSSLNGYNEHYSVQQRFICEMNL